MHEEKQALRMLMPREDLKKNLNKCVQVLYVYVWLVATNSNKPLEVKAKGIPHQSCV